MPTYIYSKKDFITYLEKQLTDKDVVVLTTELSGNLSMSKKNGLKLSHVYAPNCFKDEGLGHIAFGKSHPLGIIITGKERLSDVSKRFLDKAEIETVS
jgi:hypothetical protein